MVCSRTTTCILGGLGLARGHEHQEDEKVEHRRMLNVSKGTDQTSPALCTTVTLFSVLAWVGTCSLVRGFGLVMDIVEMRSSLFSRPSRHS